MSLKALSDYTFISRYSHYLPDLKRRETWHEAVERVYNMHKGFYQKEISEHPELLKEIEFAESQQKKKRVLAAQRSLQFGGSFILKHNVRLYNCSATHIDRPRAFQEAMYVLLCGCGVGFSVQYPHVSKLPAISTRSGTAKTFLIPDSIEGWSDAIGILLSSYFDADTEFSQYKGRKVVFDFSSIRPKGSLVANQFLAPGPEGLANSLEKIEGVIESRINSEDFKTGKWANKLRPIDCYDIIMHMSDAVLSGGVRRSATLCLFSYEDKLMSNAKTGDWFIKHPQRARSNNSAALIKGQVSREQFAELMKSTRQFGEPGFVWLDDVDICYNPCVVGKTLINTSRGLRRADNLINQPFEAVVDGKLYKSSGFIQTGIKPVYKVDTSRGHSIEVTGNHKILTKSDDNSFQWVEASDLSVGDNIVIGQNDELALHIDSQSKDFAEGWLVGSIVGDGGHNPDKYPSYVRFWGDTASQQAEKALDFLSRFFYKTYSVVDHKGVLTMQGKALTEIASKYLTPKDKQFTDQVFEQSDNFLAGLIQGYYDADGTVFGKAKGPGIAVRLCSNSKERLKDVQIILNRFGIVSSIYNIHPERTTLMPNGKGSSSLYTTKQTYDLHFSRKSVERFVKLCNFGEPTKASKLNDLLQQKTRTSYKNQATTEVISVSLCGYEPVYDCCVEEVHRFEANGLIVHNCVEIGLYPKTADGRSGWEFCNLTEINGRYCDTEEKFLQCCRAAATIGTLQAGYTNFTYLTEETREIVKKEALLGVSITGIMDNPDVLLNPAIQRKGAKEVKAVNIKIAKLIGINPSARTTCTKPAGSTSCILSTASGIHPHHAKRYIRRVQANKSEFCVQEFERQNPIAVEESVWSANKTDKVISFLCEVPLGAITKNQLGAVDLLKNVLTSQQNWVEYGTNPENCIKPYIRHNISNTITVKDDEWEDVEDFIFRNQKWFAGISLLPASGDLDYAQAPFTTILSPTEIAKEYGDGAVFASGLIVDGLKAFENLWKACDAISGFGETLVSLETLAKPVYPQSRSNKALAEYFLAKEIYDMWFAKHDWIRRANQFANRYFDGDVRKMTYCLKHVYLWKTWCDLKREYKEIDWVAVIEETAQQQAADTLGAQSCSGGACEII